VKAANTSFPTWIVYGLEEILTYGRGSKTLFSQREFTMTETNLLEPIKSPAYSSF
jgi:hypothetical protein